MKIQQRYDLTKTPLTNVLAKELPECLPKYYEGLITDMRNRLTDGRREVPDLTSIYTLKSKKGLEIELHESVLVKELEGKKIYGDNICGSRFIIKIKDGKPILTPLNND